ncbi:hypothetical protein KKH23_05195 [Patescibacteria group bacterium]|nr:hypothetical protein [Patescibacteria group bacterium]MBU0846565.1 hypothetical protein [Patescibacteria group bacterium]
MSETNNAWCKCLKLPNIKINSIMRELISYGANDDWIPLKNIFEQKDKAQAMFELVSLAKCNDLVKFKTATRAYTKNEKNFAAIPIGSDFAYVSHIKLEDDWKEKMNELDKKKH